MKFWGLALRNDLSAHGSKHHFIGVKILEEHETSYEDQGSKHVSAEIGQHHKKDQINYS